MECALSCDGASFPVRQGGFDLSLSEGALRSTFPVRGDLEWFFLPARTVSGLGLSPAFPLDACPLALRKGRLAAREGLGEHARIYLVDCLSAAPVPPPAGRRRNLRVGPLSRIARREARMILAYSGASPGLAGLRGRRLGSARLEAMASLYYLVVLCGRDAYSLSLGDASRDFETGKSAIAPPLAGWLHAAAIPVPALDSLLSSRCRSLPSRPAACAS